MIRSCHATLWLLVAAVALFITTASAADGTMKAQFQVTPDGAASYAVPISVPPGTGGLEPNLRIEYSSNSGNGVLGIGWQLSGLSKITRCPALLEPDGFIDPVDYDNNDRLCLDGQRLVAVSGTYGRNGAQYRTEIESFSKIVQHGNLSSSGSWFEVYTKDGRISEYGHGNYSSVSSPGQNQQPTVIWAVNRTADRSGNYMEFNYRDRSFPSVGGPDISQIDYGANDAAGITHGNSIKFSYRYRINQTTNYYAGDEYRRDSMLQTAISYSGNTPVTSYEFRYSDIIPILHTRLNGIRQCGEKPQRDCLPWTTFEWSDFDDNYTQPQSAIAFSSVNQYSKDGLRETFIDLNGDGLDYPGFHGQIN